MAQNVQIRCGSTEIHGYAFCSGVNKLNLSYEANPALENVIRSVTGLIRGAVFRSHHASAPRKKIPLGELVDLYHTRKATERHDKVYALLGMSSDDSRAAGLLPDYDLPWKELMRRLIGLILPQAASVENFEEQEMVIVKNSGYVIGRVSSVESDSNRYDRRLVSIVLPCTNTRNDKNIYWTIRVSGKDIRENDIICFLQGALEPSIIRPFRDHSSIVMLSVTRQLHRQQKLEHSYERMSKRLTNDSSCDFLLVWDWESIPETWSDYEFLEHERGINDLASGYLAKPLDEATALYNMGLVVGDSGPDQWISSGLRLSIAAELYEEAYEKGDLRKLDALEKVALAYGKQKMCPGSKKLFLRIIQERRRTQGLTHPDTLISVANLISNGQRLIDWDDGPSLADRIANQIRSHVALSEAHWEKISRIFDPDIVGVLLEHTGNEILITKRVIEAVDNRNDEEAKAIMVQFCTKNGKGIKITEDATLLVANRFDSEVLGFLLKHKGKEYRISKYLIRAVNDWRGASNLYYHLCSEYDWWCYDTEGRDELYRLLDLRDKMMEFFIREGGKHCQITYGAIVEIAACSTDEAMRLALEQAGNDFTITEEILAAAAKNAWMGEDVSKILLEHKNAMSW